MINNSTTAGPPHFVDLHVNPGESVSIQLFDGNETVLRGPATVTMISQHTFPPVPMPVQVPPGHMVQQIVDENGTLRHIILSAINNNGTNSTSPATLVPQQQAYPYSCCCYCYCSSMPSPNPLPTPPPPPPPPPPIHHSNLWEMGLTHVDSSRRLPFSSRSNNSKVNACNIDMTFPPSPTATIRRRLPNNRNYSYTKRSPTSNLLQTTTTTTTNTSSTNTTLTTTTTTTTSIGAINSSTSITTTTITTTSTGTSPSSNSHHHSNSFVVNGVTSTTTITTTKLTSSGVLSIAAVTSNLTSTTSTTTTTVAAISTTTSGSSTYNNLINSKDNSGSIPLRGINGKSQTLTVTVSESGTVNSKTGAITFPVNHLRTNGGGNVATKLTSSIPELITSTDQQSTTKYQHHHTHQHQHPHGYSHHQHSHQHHSQSPKIEFLFNNSSNNPVTSGGYNTNYNNKHNSIVSNLPSSTSNHHHHHHHHHNIVTHGGNNGGGDSNKLMVGDNEKLKISSSHHNNKDPSSTILMNRNSTSSASATTTINNQSTNGLLIGSPSSPIKSVVGTLTSSGSKGSNGLTNSKSSSIQSSNHSPKNDHLSRKVRKDDKMKEESIKSKENVTPSRKKSNINSSSTPNGVGNYTYDGETERNSSGASSSSSSKESSPIKISWNRLSHPKSTLQSSSSIPAINVPINVTLATGPQSTTTLPIISLPLESSTLTKKRSDSLTVSSVDSVEVKSRKESKESFTLTGNSINKSNGRNLNNRDQQSITGSLPISVIINGADNLSVESPLMESDTKSIDKLPTKPNVLKVIDSNDNEDKGDNEEKGDGETIRISPKKGLEVKKRKDKIDQSDGQVNQQSDKEETFDDNSVIQGDGSNDSKEPLKYEMDSDKEIDDSTIELKCKSDDKIDSQQLKSSSSTTTTTPSSATMFNEDVNRVAVHVVGAQSVGDSTSTHARDNLDKDIGDKKVEVGENGDNHEEQEDEEEEDEGDEEDEDEDEDEGEEESSLTGDIKQNNYITSTGSYGDSIDVNRVKAKSSPQRSPKHLLPQVQVFCLNYTSLTATSVKLKWINEQSHHNNYHHSHHHFSSSSYGGGGNGSIMSETRHYMVEMMKLNRSNAKNGTVTPTTRIVYQGTQASCRVSHLTPSEQYSFRVRSSENNHQLVSNVLTLVTPEHQPVNKHHKRSRTQNTNQQIQFASESSSQKQQHTIQNQEQAASRQQESLNNKIDGETRIIRSEQKCAIVIISLVSVLAVVLACIIHNLLMY